jgi:anaerobic selenocysteine-containing dehydrogenase
VSDLRTAGAVLLAGANIAESMPPLLNQLRGVIDAGGLIVIDPRARRPRSSPRCTCGRDRAPIRC